MSSVFGSHVLDDPIGASLRGPHARFAIAEGEGSGSIVRYPPNIAPFASLGLAPGASSWASLRALLAGDTAAMFVAPDLPVPEPWVRVATLGLTQMTDDAVDLDAVVPLGRTRALGRADVPEMLRLTAATEPGPFLDDTVEFGGYRGVFDGDTLVAMAGRRLNPPGWFEISAVCTDPDYRGRGYAKELLVEVLRGIRAEGSRGFLHVAAGNPARAVYEGLGFVARADFEVAVVRHP